MLPNFLYDPNADKGTPESRKELRFGLCLSGGGARAAIFHLGVLTGLHRNGLLECVDRISAVSGGSITAAMYGVERAKAEQEGKPFEFENFLKKAASGLSDGVRNKVILGLANPLFSYRWLVRRHTRTDLLASAYDRVFFKGATLGDLPTRPEIYMTSTCLNDGWTWAFSRNGVDRIVAGAGHREKPKTSIPVSLAVAASSAVPGLFPPICKDRAFFFEAPDPRPQHSHYKALHFSDGGIADNLGLISMYIPPIPEVILISDAGARFSFLASPPRSVILGHLPIIGRHIFGGAGVLSRTIDIMMYHVNEFISAASQPHLGMVDQYLIKIGSTVPNGLPEDVVKRIAGVRTDLDRFSQMEFYAIFMHGLSHGVNYVLGRYGYLFGGNEKFRKGAQIDQPSKRWKERAVRHLSHSGTRSWMLRRILRLWTFFRTYRRPQPGDDEGWDHMKEKAELNRRGAPGSIQSRK